MARRSLYNRFVRALECSYDPVAVIGNAAGGKSTLCRQLSHARKLPYFPVDKIQWRPGWQLVPESEFAAKRAAVQFATKGASNMERLRRRQAVYD